MKLYLSPNKTKTTVVEHPDADGVIQTLEFSNNTLAKTAFVATVNDENPIFTHINRYFERIPMQRQNEIFEIITEIQNTIECPQSIEDANEKLKILFGHLFQRIVFDEILHYLRTDPVFSHDISMPSADNIKMRYDETMSDNYTKEKTYIYSEYEELIALIIQLRVMFPIWAHYIEVFSNKLGTNYKEFEAFKLITGSALFQNRAMEKLATYVKAITPDEGSKAAIIDFISSEDYPIYNLSLVVVRKMCTMEIRNPGERAAIIIMHISTHVREKITNSDKKQGSIISEKGGSDANNRSEERQVSMIERFKIREKLSIGTKVFLTEITSNPMDVAQKLSPNVNLDYVTLINAARSNVFNAPVERVQKIFLKNILSSIVSYRVVDLLEKEHLISCLSAASAVLIAEGFEDIAPYLTASVINTESTSTIASDQHQNKVSVDLREKMQDLWKFQRSSKSKIVTNPITENVDLIFKEISSKAWYNNFPDALLTTKVRRMQNPTNLRIRLTNLAIYLAERKNSALTAEEKLNNLF